MARGARRPRRARDGAAEHPGERHQLLAARRHHRRHPEQTPRRSSSRSTTRGQASPPARSTTCSSATSRLARASRVAECPAAAFRPGPLDRTAQRRGAGRPGRRRQSHRRWPLCDDYIAAQPFVVAAQRPVIVDVADHNLITGWLVRRDGLARTYTIRFGAFATHGYTRHPREIPGRGICADPSGHPVRRRRYAPVAAVARRTPSSSSSSHPNGRCCRTLRHAA